MAATQAAVSPMRNVRRSAVGQGTYVQLEMAAIPAAAWMTVAGPVPSDYVPTMRFAIVMVVP